MSQGLQALGVEIDVIATSDQGNIDVLVQPHLLRGPAAIDVGLAGTVMRFLPPVAIRIHRPTHIKCILRSINSTWTCR
jgi:3-phosphoshikimate 1-carboxyvinyltransferase